MSYDSSILTQINSALENNNITLFLKLCNDTINNATIPNYIKAQASFTLASYYRNIGDSHNAIIAFSKTITFDSEKTFAYIRKIELLLDLKRLDAAKHCYDEAINKFPNNQKLLSLRDTFGKMNLSNSNDNVQPLNKPCALDKDFINNDNTGSTSLHSRPSSTPDCTSSVQKGSNDYLKSSDTKKTLDKIEVNSNDYTKPQYPNKIKKDVPKKSNTGLIILCSVLCTVAVFALSFFAYVKFIKTDNSTITVSESKPSTVSDNDSDENSSSKPQNNDNATSNDNSKEVKETKQTALSKKYLVNNENPNVNFKGSLNTNKDFVFPDSDRVKLSYSDLTNKTLDELFVARNEIFARHGYVFSVSPKLNTYFESKSWYVSNSNYKGEFKNDIENFNSDLIKQVEVSRIAHYNYGENTLSNFVIQDSDSRTLSENDVKNLKDWELIIARNEIFARHGLRFGVPQIADHFSSKSWYKADPNCDVSKLSTLENNNIQTIIKEELIRYTKILNR